MPPPPFTITLLFDMYEEELFLPRAVFRKAKFRAAGDMASNCCRGVCGAIARGVYIFAAPDIRGVSDVI